jgi:hypothetical protein
MYSGFFWLRLWNSIKCRNFSTERLVIYVSSHEYVTHRFCIYVRRLLPSNDRRGLLLAVNRERSGKEAVMCVLEPGTISSHQSHTNCCTYYKHYFLQCKGTHRKTYYTARIWRKYKVNQNQKDTATHRKRQE